MATQIRLRRDTTANHQTYSDAEGVVTYDTDKKAAVLHDGTTDGGFPHLRADRPRGYTKLEHFTSSATWTKTNKPDLKRIVVHAIGGGGGGGNNTSGGSGGGSGAHGYVQLDVANVTTDVSVTIGSGGNSAGGSGGDTYFGPYIRANGGGGGENNNYGIGGNTGTVSGTDTYQIGGYAGNGLGYSATANANFGWVYGTGGGPGGQRGNAVGVFGGGGGASNGSGAPGSVLVYEIYGEY